MKRDRGVLARETRMVLSGLALCAAACSAEGGSAGTTGGAGGTLIGAGGAVGGAGGEVTGSGGFPPVGGAGGIVGTGGEPGAGGEAQSTGGTIGAGGIPGAGGTPGSDAIGAGAFAGYDPNVAFDWPESLPTAGSCKAGRYEGIFDGWYASPIIAGFPVPIFGNVSLVLEESQDGEFYEITEGTIAGFVYGFVPFESGLTGRLNCTTAQLDDGFMPNGRYSFGGIDYPYEGFLDASYDKLTNQFTGGAWEVGEPTHQRGDPLPQFHGLGTWNAAWVGP